MLLVLGALVAGCGPGEPERFRISGKLENGAGLTVYLDQLTTNSIDQFGSAMADEDGSFTLEGEISEVGFYKVRLGDNNFVNIVIHPEDDLEMTGDANYLYGTYTVEGSEDAVALYELNEFLRQFKLKEDSLRKVATSFGGVQVDPSRQFQLQSIYNNMVQEKLTFLRSFIDNNTTSISSLAAIEGLDPMTDSEYFIKLDKELYALYPNSMYVKNLHLRAAQMTKLAIGAEAPQILLANPEGEVVSLSSLRGKIVLIDFWASWCKPCRLENPHVVKLYNEYRDRGFEVYGVSLDKNKQAWVNAIQQDGLEWIHVSDLQFWNSAAAKLYNVNSIPKTFLIDEDGKIIAKNLRAAELGKKLKEILG